MDFVCFLSVRKVDVYVQSPNFLSSVRLNYNGGSDMPSGHYCGPWC